ncbi:endonuclease/exonuclease/phosphatase family protein [Marinicrinis sediminis]|uniref:Endonuclease/exonuclease/phosphatase family protein n=1 Tax=Marinicrinis sediminis TaxID=1652465 RepID=A0ABW5RCN2_9BACL
MNHTKQIPISFLTWNVYVGADLNPTLSSPIQLVPQRVTEAYRQFLATNFPQRAKAIAKQIKKKQPDIIGLQEVARWELIPPRGNRVVFDFLQILLRQLKLLGLDYKVAAVNRNLSDQLPASTGNIVRLTDRDVILVKNTCRFKIIRRMSANYKASLNVRIGGQTIRILRGYSFIDVKVNGHVFRAINTHLEPLSPKIRQAQANELLAGPASTKLPQILMGDLNSNANRPGMTVYRKALKSGFNDPWTIAGIGKGFTCCQDRDVLSARSRLSERIDYVLFKRKINWRVIRTKRVGACQASRTPTRLWPSDHAGVFAKLVLRSR